MRSYWIRVGSKSNDWHPNKRKGYKKEDPVKSEARLEGYSYKPRTLRTAGSP